jgi:hypothetical protein
MERCVPRLSEALPPFALLDYGALWRSAQFPIIILLTDKAWLKVAATPFKSALQMQVFTEQPEHHYCFLRDLPLGRQVKTLYLQRYFQTNLLAQGINALIPL